MSTARAVARGTTRLLAGLIAARALDLCFYLLLARRLGVEEFGRYSFALSFTLLFSMLADVGVATVFTREVSRAPGRVRALLRDVLGLKLVLALLTAAATVAITIASGASRATLVLVALFTCAMLVGSVALLFENLLKSAGRAGAAGVSVLLQSAILLAAGATLVLPGRGAIGGACAYLIAALVQLAAVATWSRALWSRPVAAPTSATPTRLESRPGRLALLREALPLALSWAFITLYFRVDSILLQVCQGVSAVGLYGGIFRFFEAFALLSAAYRSVLFPVMARAADGPAGSLAALCRKSLRLHLMFTIGVAVFFTFEARHIIIVVLGPAYAAAAPALAMLMWALPAAFMTDTVLHLLVARRQQSVSARAIATTAAFNLALNLILIPILSLLGAAIAMVAGTILSFALMFLAFSRSAPRVSLYAVARAPLAAGAFAAVALALVSPLNPGGAPGLALMGLFAARPTSWRWWRSGRWTARTPSWCRSCCLRRSASRAPGNAGAEPQVRSASCRSPT